MTQTQTPKKNARITPTSAILADFAKAGVTVTPSTKVRGAVLVPYGPKANAILAQHGFGKPEPRCPNCGCGIHDCDCTD
jgi:hypothetical protein